jgi:hydroxyacyl-ACP dehydratase HTD2-like protein with hotdog domain
MPEKESNEIKIVHIRLPKSLWVTIKTQSEARGQTASSEIRRALYREFASTSPKTKEGSR